MTDDVLFNKVAIIERCLRRIKQEYALCPDLNNYTHIDAITLNLERACQAAIDMAMHLLAREHLGIPQSSAHAFELLYKAGKIDSSLARAMKSMVGFRNIAVHEYQSLNPDIFHYVVKEGYKDFIRFCEQLGFQIKVEP
ncbi:MAG: DUF86 domain-containing protein [Deltaproteobacteria bacterium]|nr:DUF86 domain-containing protein [Deltaproteobacteria bacterium]MBW2099295.1 DUF86 domain-containing protein [Deltaproteobacteria bacterium]